MLVQVKDCKNPFFVTIVKALPMNTYTKHTRCKNSSHFTWSLLEKHLPSQNKRMQHGTIVDLIQANIFCDKVASVILRERFYHFNHSSRVV